MAWVAFRAPRRQMPGAATQAMPAALSRSGNAADADAPPEPGGRMGVASDLIVARRWRCAAASPASSRLDLASQAPCARPMPLLGQAPSTTLSDPSIDLCG